MENISLVRSKKAFTNETRLILISAIIVALLAALLMRIFIRFTVGYYLLSGSLTFIGIMLLAWVAILIRSKKWDNTNFVLSPDALLVTRMQGFMGTTTQDVYRYESIITARVKKSYFGQKYGYGDIELTIPKLEQKLILKSIARPDEQLAIIKNHMEHKSKRSRELVT